MSPLSNMHSMSFGAQLSSGSTGRQALPNGAQPQSDAGGKSIMSPYAARSPTMETDTTLDPSLEQQMVQLLQRIDSKFLQLLGSSSQPDGVLGTCACLPKKACIFPHASLIE